MMMRWPKNDLRVSYTSACKAGDESCGSFANPGNLTPDETTAPVNKDIDGYRLRVDVRLLKHRIISEIHVCCIEFSQNCRVA